MPIRNHFWREDNKSCHAPAAKPGNSCVITSHGADSDHLEGIFFAGEKAAVITAPLTLGGSAGEILPLIFKYRTSKYPAEQWQLHWLQAISPKLPQTGQRRRRLATKGEAAGGKSIWYPNKHHLPISFYLPTALSVGVGWLLAHCRERKGGAGLKQGMQQAMGCGTARGPWGHCSLEHSDLLPQGKGLAMPRSLLPSWMQAGWHWTSACSWKTWEKALDGEEGWLGVRAGAGQNH